VREMLLRQRMRGVPDIASIENARGASQQKKDRSASANSTATDRQKELWQTGAIRSQRPSATAGSISRARLASSL
jgi:hypothetical protein